MNNLERISSSLYSKMKQNILFVLCKKSVVRSVVTYWVGQNVGIKVTTVYYDVK